MNDDKVEETTQSTATPNAKLTREIELPSSVLGFDASADGKRLYAACLDGGVFEVDSEAGTLRELGRHGSYAAGVCLIQDSLLVSAGYDGVVAWRDPAGKTIREVKAHAFWSWQLTVSPDSRRVASSTGQYLCGGYDYEPLAEREPSVKVFDATSGEVTHELSHVPPVQSVAFDPTSRYLAAGNLMGEIRIWDLETGSEVSRWTTPSFTGWGIIKGHYYTGGVFSLSFSPDGEHLLLAGMGTTRDPAAGNGKQLWQRFAWRENPSRKIDETRDDEAGQGLMETLRFHPSGKWFVMAGRIQKGEWNFAVFDTETGHRVLAESTQHRVTNARFSADGSRLFLAGAISQGAPKSDGSFQPFGRIKIYDFQS